MNHTTRYINKLFKIVNHHSIDIIWFIFLTLCSIKLTYFIDRTDIDLYDESVYLEGGVKMFELPYSIRSPLYSFWYYLIYQVQHDKVALFFLSFKILVFLTTLALYFYLRRLQISPFVAGLTSFLYLMSPIPHLVPRPTHVALLTLLVFLFIGTFSKRREDYFLILALGTLAASYARAEYFLSFIIFCALSVFLIVWNWRREPRRVSSFIPKIFLFSIIISILFLVVGNPFEGGNVSVLAFGQNFSVNWTMWNHSDIDPMSNWIPITESVFGKISSPYEALLSNPKAFFRHIFTNFLGYFPAAISLVMVKIPAFSSSPIWLLTSKLIKFFEILFLIAVIIYLGRKRKVILKQWDQKTFSNLVIVFICISTTVIPSTILFYPRGHYIMIQAVIALAIIAYLISNSIPKTKIKRTGLIKAVTIGLLLFILTPSYPLTTIATPNTNVIRFIDKLNIKSQVNLSESEGGYSFYLGNNYNWVHPWQEESEKESYKQFALRKKINMIVLSEEFIKNNLYKDDNDFKLLLSQPESVGFSRLDIPGSSRVLLVKNELLAGRHQSN